MGRRQIEVDAARLEALARTERTQLAVAMGLGMSQGALVRKLFERPELRRAYERGRIDHAAGVNEERRLPALITPEPPEPLPAEAVKAAGGPAERVLAALAQGGRTTGELMADTNLDWHRLVETVNRLTLSRRVVAREVCGKRLHYLAGSEPQPPVYEDVDDGDAMEANW